MVCFVLFIFCSDYFCLYLPLGSFMPIFHRKHMPQQAITGNRIWTPASEISLIPVKWKQHCCKHTGYRLCKPKLPLIVCVCVGGWCLCTHIYIHIHIRHTNVCVYACMILCDKIDIHSCFYFTLDLNTEAVLAFLCHSASQLC